MQFRRKLLVFMFKLSDIFIFIGAYIFSYLFVTDTLCTITIKSFLSLSIQLFNMFLLVGMIFFWHLLFITFRLYLSRRLTSKIYDVKDILKATSTGTIIFFFCGKLFNVEIVTIYFCFIFWSSISIFTILYRILLKYFLKILRKRGRNLRFVVIVGTNRRAYAIGKQMKENQELGYFVKGYIDDIVFQPNKDINLIGCIDDIPDIIRSEVVDEIFVALPIKSHYEVIQTIIKYAEEQGVVTHYLSHYFKTMSPIVEQSTIEGFPVSAIVNRQQHESAGFLIKRIFDVLGAATLLILTSPLLLLGALAVLFTSPGSIIFVQERVGLNKRMFRMYKFRTMVINADKLQAGLESANEMDGPVFKIQNDPRITRVGKWLRKTSIDELPQLVNVLKGDMSLVGPRPLPVRDYYGFAEDWQRRRFSVRPGLTCFWQISGRNNISFEKWMQLDMEYIDQWSFWLDLKIIFRTIPTVLKGFGAS